MTDPENDQRLLKIPPNIVAAIKAEAYTDAMDAVEALPDAIFQQAAWVKHEEAINAIDALREDSDD